VPRNQAKKGKDCQKLLWWNTAGRTCSMQLPFRAFLETLQIRMIVSSKYLLKWHRITTLPKKVTFFLIYMRIYHNEVAHAICEFPKLISPAIFSLPFSNNSCPRVQTEHWAFHSNQGSTSRIPVPKAKDSLRPKHRKPPRPLKEHLQKQRYVVCYT